MNTIQTIALNKLVPSKANVRKTGAEEELPSWPRASRPMGCGKTSTSGRATKGVSRSWPGADACGPSKCL
jgi:hypothetical protein